MALPHWPPSARIRNYSGPYPVNELEEARGVLIRCLEDRNSGVSTNLKCRIGITNYRYHSEQRDQRVSLASVVQWHPNEVPGSRVTIAASLHSDNDGLQHQVGDIVLLQSWEL